MGNYLNPGNSRFESIRNGQYVDKSGLIQLINETIDTAQKLTCISRPRRFGKSFAAQMLCAYYDKTCDSTSLFDDLKIAQDKKYREYLNKYDVIYLDMTSVIGATAKDDIISYVVRKVTEELSAAYPGLQIGDALFETLANATALAGNKFVMIIDEWDAPIRETADRPEIQRGYLEFLRSLFKNSGMTSKIFAAVYMTGILPIKKDGSQSAISDFEEYTMVQPGRFAEYVGFTEEEVKESDQLIYDTVHGNADAVAAQIEKIHAEETAIGKPELRVASFGYRKVPSPDYTFLNDEQALRSVVKLAYFSYKDYYLKFEELPAGNGYADIVYLPKKDSPLPALVIELKWNKSAVGAIEQIKDKHYPDAIKDYGGEVLLVGINYDKDAPAGERKHTCKIEKLQRQ